MLIKGFATTHTRIIDMTKEIIIPISYVFCVYIRELITD